MKKGHLDSNVVCALPIGYQFTAPDQDALQRAMQDKKSSKRDKVIETALESRSFSLSRRPGLTRTTAL